MSVTGTLERAVAKVRGLVAQGSFGRGAVVLASGSGLASVIAVVSSPIIARIYSPVDFGMLGVYTALAGVSVAVACGSYHLAIAVPKEDSDALVITQLAILVTVPMGGILAILVWSWGGTLASLLNSPGLERFLWLLPVSAVFGGAYTALSYLTLRQHGFTDVARTKVSQEVARAVAAVFLGLAGLRPLGLLLGVVLQQGVGVGGLARRILGRVPLVGPAKPKELLEAARRYVRFPLVSTWASILSVVGLSLPPLLLATFYGQTDVGSFVLTRRTVAMPMAVLGTAIAQAYLGHAAGSSLARTKRMYLRLSKILFFAGMPCAGVIVVAAPWAFRVVFGEAWADAARFAQVLAVAALAQLVVNPVGQM